MKKWLVLSVMALTMGAMVACTFNADKTHAHVFGENNLCTICGLEKPEPTEGLKYTLNEDGTSYCVSGFGTASVTDIVIAEEYEGLPVTRIDNNAFSCMKVTVGGGFELVDRVTSMIIPDSVTSIGEFAFQGCSFTNIHIPNSVTSIGYGAFYACYNIRSITIPNSVTSIEGGVFGACESLTSITVEKGNPVYHSYKNSIIETNSKTLIAGCMSSKMPTDGSVTSIGDSAFYSCVNLKSIKIPNDVTSIGEGAFAFCENLKSIAIPESVTSIPERVFYCCTNLESITIPDSITSIENNSFCGSESLKSITVDKNNPFYHSSQNCLIETNSKTLLLGCMNSNIPVDGSVTSIGKYAFEDCIGLTNITIPNSIISIGDCAFGRCYNLTDITYQGMVAEWEAVKKVREGLLTGEGVSWDNDIPTYIIHCTDGDISKDGTITPVN